MPDRDGTGPSGMGRRLGRCATRPTESWAVVILRFVLENWRPIAGFLLTTLVPLISRRFLKIESAAAKEPLQLKIEKKN